MNFAQIVKKNNFKVDEIESIQSQAETELGRKLGKAEECLLLTRFSQGQLHRQILEVYIKNNFL